MFFDNFILRMMYLYTISVATTVSKAYFDLSLAVAFY